MDLFNELADIFSERHNYTMCRELLMMVGRTHHRYISVNLITFNAYSVGQIYKITYVISKKLQVLIGQALRRVLTCQLFGTVRSPRNLPL